MKQVCSHAGAQHPRHLRSSTARTVVKAEYEKSPSGYRISVENDDTKLWYWIR